jgi:hypothetical protein
MSGPSGSIGVVILGAIASFVFAGICIYKFLKAKRLNNGIAINGTIFWIIVSIICMFGSIFGIVNSLRGTMENANNSSNNFGSSDTEKENESQIEQTWSVQNRTDEFGDAIDGSYAELAIFANDQSGNIIPQIAVYGDVGNEVVVFHFSKNDSVNNELYESYVAQSIELKTKCNGEVTSFVLENTNNKNFVLYGNDYYNTVVSAVGNLSGDTVGNSCDFISMLYNSSGDIKCVISGFSNEYSFVIRSDNFKDVFDGVDEWSIDDVNENVLLND